MIIALAGLPGMSVAAKTAYLAFTGAKHEEPTKDVAKPATFVDLPDVLVNLAGSGTDRTQYLKVKIVLELPDPLLVGKIHR